MATTKGPRPELDQADQRSAVGHDGPTNEGVGVEGGRLASLSRSGRLAYGASRNLSTPMISALSVVQPRSAVLWPECVDGSPGP